MTWEGHPRTTTPHYRAARLVVFQRDGDTCHVCGQPGATEIDHIIPWAEGGTDDPSNLAPIHPSPCHATKSSQEGNRARWGRRKRPTETHPGMR